MKKKTMQETKIHSNPILRNNSIKYNRKILFQKNKDATPIEIDSYLNTIQTPTKENQEQPIQKNKARILAEIESFLNHLEHPERYNRTLLLKKNKGTLLAKKTIKNHHRQRDINREPHRNHPVPHRTFLSDTTNHAKHQNRFHPYPHSNLSYVPAERYTTTNIRYTRNRLNQTYLC
jgi:hypothetical protein